MSKTILILAANPRDTTPLRLDQEVREIANGLQRATRRDDFVLEQKWAVRPVDVRRAMLDLKPNIVHFCGHGAGREGLAFEDEDGLAKLVDAETLDGFFELFADTVECVILNACYSEAQAEAITKHIDFVIGMKKEIGDAAPIEFAVAFYDALGAGKSVQFAYRLARNAVRWAGIPEHLEPVLRTRRSRTADDTSAMTAFCYLNREGIDGTCSEFGISTRIEDKYSRIVPLLLSQLKEQDVLAFSLKPSERRFTYVAAEFRLADDDEMYLAFRATEDSNIRMNLRKAKSTLWPHPTKMPAFGHVALAMRYGVEFQVFGEWYTLDYLRPHAVAVVGRNLGGYNTLVID
jgi:hypothetical protein